MSRFARHRRVFYLEEVCCDLKETQDAFLAIKRSREGVYVVTPHLPLTDDIEIHRARKKQLVSGLIKQHNINRPTLWYYTPMGLELTGHLASECIIYDCMDELKSFKNSPVRLPFYETLLLSTAHLVFTGGLSLYHLKKDLHPRVYNFPSSVDVEHFAKARFTLPVPEDLKVIPKPRAIYVGVIDERLDLELVSQLTSHSPDIHLVFVGPVCKISEKTLPRASKIHWLGQKPYGALPYYLSHCQAALVPFSLNDSTKNISPTKIPEYLAAGLPVVSTGIADVISTYSSHSRAAPLVEIATANDFGSRISKVIQKEKRDPNWLKEVDHFLSLTSWNRTWAEMARLEVAVSPRKRKSV